MQLLPNTASQRQLTFLQFTWSLGSQSKKTAPIVLGEGESQAGKKQRADEEEEECTGKVWPQFCVFCVLPQLYLVQRNTSHIKGSYLDRQGRLCRGKRSLPEQKHCWKTSSCTAFVVFWLLTSIANKWVLVAIPKLYLFLIPYGVSTVYLATWQWQQHSRNSTRPKNTPEHNMANCYFHIVSVWFKQTTYNAWTNQL